MKHVTQQAKEATSRPRAHQARRIVRYRAAENAKYAIKRQFPGLFSESIVQSPRPSLADRQETTSDAAEAA